MSKDIVLKFINGFKTLNYTDSIEYTFLRGYCYWFAVILFERFKNEYQCEIWFDPEWIHFATRIDYELYDITGEVQFTNDFVPWEQYKSDMIAKGNDDIITDLTNTCIKKVY